MDRKVKECYTIDRLRAPDHHAARFRPTASILCGMPVIWRTYGRQQSQMADLRFNDHFERGRGTESDYGSLPPSAASTQPLIQSPVLSLEGTACLAEIVHAVVKESPRLWSARIGPTPSALYQ